jgi:hypothetical protein
MAKFPSTYAVDTGNKLNERFYDVVWMSTEGVVPEQRWFISGEELPKGEKEPTKWGYGTVDEHGHLVVRYYREEVFGPIENVPKLWFILVDGSPVNPNTKTMFGFADDTHPWGTVIELDEALRVLDKNHMSTWAGMIIWGKGDPFLQQITTAENWRRKRIAVMMMGVCDVVNACYGFSPGKVLHGGEITTEDGEKLRNIYPGATSRIKPRIGSVKNVEDLGRL